MISSHFYIIPDYEIWPRFGQEKAPVFDIWWTSALLPPYVIWFIQEFTGLFFHP